MLTPIVQTVQVLPDYCLGLTFDNSESAVLDIKPCLDFSVFARLRDLQAFAKLFVSFDRVEWPCGVDLAPAFVHEKSRVQSVA